jgi:hypothetical protein
MTGEGLVEICKHYADHLEDVAIAASPLTMDSDDDSDTDSAKSRKHETDEKGKLPVINEDLEESTETAAQLPPTRRGDFDIMPACAICSKEWKIGEVECPCESERFQIAVRQAEQRALDKKLAELR